MLDTAMRLMQGGRMPSVSDVAEAAEVSRATAYRYFPSQAAMVQAVVDEALGPILDWRSELGRCRAARRGACSASPIRASTTTRRRTARRCSLALDQWAGGGPGRSADEARIVRGNRKRAAREALAPLTRQDRAGRI